MNKESIEIQMLKQQVQLLQQELQSIRKYDSVRTLWNNIFSKLETITFNSQTPKFYEQLMFRQSLSNDQIKPDYLTQDVGCQTETNKDIMSEKIHECLKLIQQESKLNNNKVVQDNLLQIERSLTNIKQAKQKRERPISENVRQSYQSNISIPTKTINLSTQGDQVKLMSNLEQELKDSQINELKKQNQQLKKEIQELQLTFNQVNTQLEEKEAKLKLLNFMVINQQKECFQTNQLFRI